MSDWFPAPVIGSLLAEVNARFPHRDKASDGIIGDASHAARVSEHNPCWTCTGKFNGIVRAVDIDSGPDGDPTHDLRREVLDAVIGDPRVWYVISNGIIYSRTYGWAARKYTGSNGHFHHVHTSFVRERAFDTQPFFAPAKPVRTKPVLLDISKVHDEFLRVVEGHKPRYSVDVKRAQRLLTARGYDTKADGLAGDKTLNNWGRLEGTTGEGRHRVPDGTVLRRVNRGMYRLVA